MKDDVLKLAAYSVEDLNIIASLTHGMRIKNSDIAFLEQTHHFIMVGERALWKEKQENHFEIVGYKPCGLHLNNIQKVQINQHISQQSILNLITIFCTPSEQNTFIWEYKFVFENQLSIRLYSDTLQLYLKDL
jgi:hypothetical protein